MMMQAGIYKARAIQGSEQYGESTTGTPKIRLDLNVPSLERTVFTDLFFSDASAEFSYERLRALGWQGDDISDLRSIDANEVEVEIRQEQFDGKQRWRVEILTRQKVANPLDKNAFAARVGALKQKPK